MAKYSGDSRIRITEFKNDGQTHYQIMYSLSSSPSGLGIYSTVGEVNPDKARDEFLVRLFSSDILGLSLEEIFSKKV
ncbi:hypothetical protein HYW76_03460 [Candidatus Pacearchaeota archaeon]|nr:hypothetical protein [Candidatus Pacearchaeota archaeon]